MKDGKKKMSKLGKMMKADIKQDKQIVKEMKKETKNKIGKDY